MPLTFTLIHFFFLKSAPPRTHFSHRFQSFGPCSWPFKPPGCSGRIIRRFTMVSGMPRKSCQPLPDEQFDCVRSQPTLSAEADRVKRSGNQIQSHMCVVTDFDVQLDQSSALHQTNAASPLHQRKIVCLYYPQICLSPALQPALENSPKAAVLAPKVVGDSRRDIYTV